MSLYVLGHLGSVKAKVDTRVLNSINCFDPLNKDPIFGSVEEYSNFDTFIFDEITFSIGNN